MSANNIKMFQASLELLTVSACKIVELRFLDLTSEKCTLQFCDEMAPHCANLHASFHSQLLDAVVGL